MLRRTPVQMSTLPSPLQPYIRLSLVNMSSASATPKPGYGMSKCNGTRLYKCKLAGMHLCWCRYSTVTANSHSPRGHRWRVGCVDSQFEYHAPCWVLQCRRIVCARRSDGQHPIPTYYTCQQWQSSQIQAGAVTSWQSLLPLQLPHAAVFLHATRSGGEAMALRCPTLTPNGGKSTCRNPTHLMHHTALLLTVKPHN
jgi:hypothetical protein